MDDDFLSTTLNTFPPLPSYKNSIILYLHHYWPSYYTIHTALYSSSSICQEQSISYCYYSFPVSIIFIKTYM